MDTTFLQRYMAGEYEAVWSELYALGPTVRDEPYLTAAQAVANETMRRARFNIERIIDRLQQLGYHFASRVWSDWQMPGWSPPTARTTDLVRALETQYGPLPLSLTAWFSSVGFVNLMGFHPILSTYADLGEAEPIYYSDPLVVEYYIEPAGYYDDAHHQAQPAPPYELMMAPCFFHKSGYSGSGTIKLQLPNPAIDFVLLDDAQRWTGTLFSTFLRESFKWGGFSGFGWSLQTDTDQFQFSNHIRDPYAHERATTLLEFLTKDLLPL